MRNQNEAFKQISLQAAAQFSRGSPLGNAVRQVYADLFKAQESGDLKGIRGASGKLGRIKAKAKAQCKVMVVKFLIRDLNLDTTMHLANQLMYTWFDEAVATATLVTEFGTKGRRADRKSEDFGRLSEPWVDSLKSPANSLLEAAVLTTESAYAALLEEVRAEFSKIAARSKD